MSIPIDYNKMQKELDRRRYMGHVYTGKVEVWQPTKLGLKTYGKWCDLVGWKNLSGEKWSSTDEFMNLAIKRNWVEVVYDFQIKENICMHTKFGHDLFRTFEYWIDEKAQKREKQKETVEKIGKGVISSLKECIQMMMGLSKGFGQLDYQDSEKKKIKRGLDGLEKNGPLG